MENAWIIPLVIYYAIVAYWKYILAAVLILVLIGWAWRHFSRKG